MLHKGKHASLESGAYDTSTFGFRSDRSFTDQVTHSPGAKYWIPTLDEWMKAVYYDPNRSGLGLEGWWEYPNSSNTPLIPGRPGIGQTSAGLNFATLQMGISLGAYTDQQSPWGLMDASGGTTEWIEEPQFGPPFTRRGQMGSSIVNMTSLGLDRVGQIGSQSPETQGGRSGLRLASAVPSPSGIVVVLAGVMTMRRRRGARANRFA